MGNFKPVLKKMYLFFLKCFFRTIYETRETACRITFKRFFFQKILGFNRKAYWPMHYTSKVSGVQNIFVGIGSAPGLSFGCYIQGGARIIIGDYVLIAPNVGIIGANHELYDHRKHSSGGGGENW